MKQVLSNYIRDELLDSHTYSDLGEDDDLLMSGLIDSLGMMSLVAFIEDELDIRVPPEDVTIDTFSTISKIAGYLETRQSKTSPRG